MVIEEPSLEDAPKIGNTEIVVPKRTSQNRHVELIRQELSPEYGHTGVQRLKTVALDDLIH